MFESTFQILADRPVALAPFLFALWGAYRVLSRHRDQVKTALMSTLIAAVIPLLITLFLAELFTQPIFQWLADATIHAEAWLAWFGFRVLDAALAAWMQVFLLFLDGLLIVLQELAGNAVPVVTDNEFLVTVFVFEFVAGIVLITALYQSADGADINAWLAASGVILFVSGIMATLLMTWQVREPVLNSGFVAAMLGFGLGVSSIILIVEPNFDRESVLAELQEAGLWSEEDAGAEGEPTEQGILGTAAARIRQLMNDRED